MITRLGPLKGSRDSSLASQIVKHARASKTSIYTVLHYAQNIANKVFTAYDWGDSKENRKRYGVPHPPSYQLSGIKTETALFWSSSDSLSSKEDMERLVKELPNVVACRKMALGHLDYLWGSQVATFHSSTNPDRIFYPKRFRIGNSIRQGFFRKPRRIGFFIRNGFG